ncbi:MAG: proton-conducting transporter membrane subunit, partial [Eubacteriales bacterium]|nr:proton-conducting transporter membrane subunit [Eubacteriales bacterium]
MGLILWLIPLIAVLLSILIKKTTVLHAMNVACSFALVVLAGFATKRVMISGILQYELFGRLFYLDALSAIILDIVVIIGFLVSIYSVGYLNGELRSGEVNIKRIQLFYTLMYSFLFTMILALTVNSIGVLWIAIEGTTLASTFLVGFHNDKHSLEAAWKYVIICSVGIAIALVGIIFLHLSSVDIIDHAHALQWNILYEHAKELNSPVLRLSFLFIVIGFGTKAGLVPMHTWLPDAHSQAPSPISALLSGVLLNSALYAVIRVLSIVNKNLGDSRFTGRIMIGFGLLSITTAAIFILTQKDYKRLLAYSSIEHMGIITLAIGLFTPLSIFAGLFHMINHSFTKAMLFLASGNIL